MANDTTIRIEGLTELRRTFRKVSKDLPKELNKELKGISAKIASRTAAKVPRLTGRAASSVVPRSGGAIAVGGTKAPHYPWLDFGGRVGRGKSISRPVIPGGRYLYPTIQEERDSIIEEVNDVLMRLAKAAGFETR